MTTSSPNPSERLGELLLNGWCMLADTCPSCQEVPLMRKNNETICVQCTLCDSLIPNEVVLQQESFNIVISHQNSEGSIQQLSQQQPIEQQENFLLKKEMSTISSTISAMLSMLERNNIPSFISEWEYCKILSITFNLSLNSFKDSLNDVLLNLIPLLSANNNFLLKIYKEIKDSTIMKNNF